MEAPLKRPDMFCVRGLYAHVTYAGNMTLQKSMNERLIESFRLMIHVKDSSLAIIK